MNNVRLFFSVSLVMSICLCGILRAEYGCMDTSYYTGQLNDPKNYYMVTGADGGPCSCPCSKYCAQYRCSLARGQCPVCRHYRIPRPYIVVSKTETSQELRPATPAERFKFPVLPKLKR